MLATCSIRQLFWGFSQAMNKMCMRLRLKARQTRQKPLGTNIGFSKGYRIAIH